MRIYIGILLSITLLGCQSSPEWHPITPIMLDDISPIGMHVDDEGIWLSDGDRNLLSLIDKSGAIKRTVTGIERPMHIDVDDGSPIVPSYGSDEVFVVGDSTHSLNIEYDMDAPAGVDVYKGYIAIADFYNHRILLRNPNQNWNTIGGPEKGKADGMFDYPTDVQIVGDRLYVADAYNHRGQVFTLDGEHLLTFGSDQEMNAATGIFVSDDQIVLTDFENDRVIVFDHNGAFVQLLDQGFLKPTEVFMHLDTMYVANYQGGYISRLVR
ncbi:MAG: hypothetical protein AAFQ02_01380 [Bacteroidota bacterium]